MKKSIKTSLLMIALALVACLVCIVCLIWLAARPEGPDEPVGESVLNSSKNPAFEVRVIVPRMARPFGGILPDALVKKMEGTPSELRVDNSSPGAQMVSVGHDRLELRADGWDLLLETDGGGQVTAGTRLVFPLALGGRPVRLNCRPAHPALGFLRTTTPSGTENIAGRFLVELKSCTNADSGKATNWPPAPLTLRGTFAGLAQGGR